jgi:hypothetical protein
MPAKYYLKHTDTLQGLSLRFGIDVSPTLITETISNLTTQLRCTKYGSSTICPQASSAIPTSCTHELS